MVINELAPKVSNIKALLLFATGGGMNVLDEVKWAIEKKLERSGATQSEIDEFLVRDCL